MEHIETPLNAGAARRNAAPPRAAMARSTGAEHRARAETLVAELRRMAAGTENPAERANLQRSADSLIRLATAYRP
ncbi:hypothetical protein ABZS29_09810 [Kribbella sp. NPDC005582]|uniref:hypothetical protein n=1 Tax=Kribbella sp. NPDC005582 TaxID=3156893 RepID=UPI0033B02AA3